MLFSTKNKSEAITVISIKIKISQKFPLVNKHNLVFFKLFLINFSFVIIIKLSFHVNLYYKDNSKKLFEIVDI